MRNGNGEALPFSERYLFLSKLRLSGKRGFEGFHFDPPICLYDAQVTKHWGLGFTSPRNGAWAFGDFPLIQP